MLDLTRDELLTVLRLVEWHIMDHEKTMRDIAPEGYIECGTVEDYQEEKARSEALMPLRAKLRAAELAGRTPLTEASFCGMQFED